MELPWKIFSAKDSSDHVIEKLEKIPQTVNQETQDEEVIKDLTIREIIKNGEIAHDFNLIQRVRFNQRKVIETINKSHKTTNLTSQHPIGGTKENYYHLLFDFLLPLSYLLPKIKKDTYLQIYSFGPLTRILSELLGNKVKILQQVNPTLIPVRLHGLSPVILKKCDFNLDPLISFVFQKFKINPTTKPTKIIFIERVKPSPYYMDKAILKGGGSKRRSIKNHRQLNRMLKNTFKPQFKFEKLVLEEMSFEEQVRHFSSAALVIGLHGAGLANAIWMAKKTHVVEIGFKNRLHFKRNCEIKQQKHYMYRNFNHGQIELNIAHFKNWLCSRQRLKAFIKTT